MLRLHVEGEGKHSSQNDTRVGEGLSFWGILPVETLIAFFLWIYCNCLSYYFIFSEEDFCYFMGIMFREYWSGFFFHSRLRLADNNLFMGLGSVRGRDYLIPKVFNHIIKR